MIGITLLGIEITLRLAITPSICLTCGRIPVHIVNLTTSTTTHHCRLVNPSTAIAGKTTTFRLSLPCISPYPQTTSRIFDIGRTFRFPRFLGTIQQVPPG